MIVADGEAVGFGEGTQGCIGRTVIDKNGHSAAVGVLGLEHRAVDLNIDGGNLQSGALGQCLRYTFGAYKIPGGSSVNGGKILFRVIAYIQAVSLGQSAQGRVSGAVIDEDRNIFSGHIRGEEVFSSYHNMDGINGDTLALCCKSRCC